MTVVVDNHVHLGDAGKFLVDFQAEQVLLGEVVPIGEMVFAFRRPFLLRKTTVGLATYMIERVEEEAAGAASGIKDDVLALGIEYLDRKGNEFARSEILAEVAL